MKKTMKIDLSSDRLIAIAADLVEEHNYISALKMLNKNAERNVNDEDSYMLYAEIFDDMGLYEKCINGWFKYIDSTLSDDLSEAYEGLAVAYMNIGEEEISACYYDKLLKNSAELDAQTRRDIFGTFISKEQNPLKFVYPPKLADYSDVITSGMACMREGEYDKAIEEFEQVEEENDAYISARNYIAMCDIITDRNEQAEQECLAILEKKPDSVDALITLAAVKTEQGKNEESRKIAQKLLSLDLTSSEERYKIATVCCENKMHAEAFELFCKLENELLYDRSVMYFKAVSAFNSGNYEESFTEFDKILTIYPDSVTARHHYEKAREYAESGEQKELSYFYRLPIEMRENLLKTLSAFVKFKTGELKKLFEVADATDCIAWCFDETDSYDDIELQFLGCLCALKAGMDGIVSDVLLNAFLSDLLKTRVLVLLGERNEYNSFGVVLCHLYRRIEFRALDLGRLKKKSFVSAYARLVAHFAFLDGSLSEKFAVSAENLYKKLESENRLSCASDVDALTAAVYFNAELERSLMKKEDIFSFFDTTENKTKNILGDL